jgi:hypothetical protein
MPGITQQIGKIAPVLLCIIAIILAAVYTFNKGTQLHPRYGFSNFFLQYPQALNLNSTTDGNNDTDSNEKLGILLTAQTKQSISKKPNTVNICKNFNCKLKPGGTESSTELDPPYSKGTNNSKTTNYCIIPDVHKNLPKNICPTTNDKCYGNCNILYDTLVKQNIDNNSGMKGVNQILEKIDNTPTDDNDVIKQQYKNQIRYLLCQMAQQNIYDYNNVNLTNISTFFTWENVQAMNGWDQPHTYNNAPFVFYIFSLLIAIYLSVRILWSILSIYNNKVFKLLYIGAGYAENMKDWGEIVLSYFIYWCVSIYFVNSIVALKIKNHASYKYSGLLNKSVGGSSVKQAPLWIAFLFWITTVVISRIICKKFGTKAINVMWTLIIAAAFAYMVTIIVETSIITPSDANTAAIPNEEGLIWPNQTDIYTTPSTHSKLTPGNISDKPIESGGTDHIFTVIPMIWLITGILSILLYGFTAIFKYKNKNKNSSTPTPTKTTPATSSVSSGQVSIGTSVMTAASSPPPNTSSGEFCNDITKINKPGRILFCTIALITYIFIMASNIFICIFFPVVFIVLLVSQRLIITNLSNLDENDWQRNWNFIFYPLINSIVFNFFGEETITDSERKDIAGLSNIKLFGTLGFLKKSNKTTANNFNRINRNINWNPFIQKIEGIKKRGLINSNKVNEKIDKIRTFQKGGEDRFGDIIYILNLLKKDKGGINQEIETNTSLITKYNNAIKAYKKDKGQRKIEDLILIGIFEFYELNSRQDIDWADFRVKYREYVKSLKK